MKTNKTVLIVAVLISTWTSWSQGFVNLNFENSKLTNVVNSGFTTTVAIVPGWSVDTFNYANGGDTNSLPYNSFALDSASISLVGTNPPFGPAAIQGKFSIMLQGGSVSYFVTNGASIWQTATIPASSLSLTYWGGPLAVSFGGQALAFSSIGNGSGYTIWGADISGLAGQTGTLAFHVPWQTFALLLDNIQFSSTAVPEPASAALVLLGGTWLFLHRQRTG